MIMKKASILVCMAILILSCAVYFFLPNTIPIHFGGNGEVDEYANRMSIFVLPLVSLGSTAIILLCRRIDPERKNYEKFTSAFYTTIFFLNLVILGSLILVIIESFRPHSIDVNAFICILLGVMMIGMGNVIPKVKHNYMIGIRTPWTLASEDVWVHTHRFGGKTIFIGGIVLLFGAFLPSTFTLAYIIICVLIMFLLPVVYSYIYFQQLANPKNKGE